MVRLRFQLATLLLVLSGCAPWAEKQSREYVTVEPDGRRDTKAAEKHYREARRHMDCHVHGQWCDLEIAEAELRKALAADVRFGPAHHSLGVLYFWRKELYLAAWEFEYTNRLMPDRYEPLNNLGLVYETAGKFDEAKVFYTLAREKAPKQPDVISNMARVSYRSGASVEQMRTLLEDVIATDPRPEWRRWAGELLGLNPPVTNEVVLPASVLPPTQPPSILPPPAQLPTEEELPLIAPPLPDGATSAPPTAEKTGLQELADVSLDIELGTALEE